MQVILEYLEYSRINSSDVLEACNSLYGSEWIRNGLQYPMVWLYCIVIGWLLLCVPNIYSEESQCDLCKSHNWLIIVGTGRSGSTTLLTLLGYLPKIVLAGENYGAANYLHRIYKVGQRRGFKAPELDYLNRTHKYGPLTRNVSEISSHETNLYLSNGSIDENHLICVLQEYAHDLIGGHAGNMKYEGWKEIRHKSEDQLDFMITKLFPCGKFVLNTRQNTEAQHRSAFQQRISSDDLRRTNENMLSWAEKHPDRVFPLALEEFSVSNMNRLLQWLGITGCSYNYIPQLNSYNPELSVSLFNLMSGRRQFQGDPIFYPVTSMNDHLNLKRMEELSKQLERNKKISRKKQASIQAAISSSSSAAAQRTYTCSVIHSWYYKVFLVTLLLLSLRC